MKEFSGWSITERNYDPGVSRGLRPTGAETAPVTANLSRIAPESGLKNRVPRGMHFVNAITNLHKQICLDYACNRTTPKALRLLYLT